MREAQPSRECPGGEEAAGRDNASKGLAGY